MKKEKNPFQLEFDFSNEIVSGIPEDSIFIPKKEIKLPFFEKAKTDNQKLLNLQFEYKNGKLEALNEIYKMGFTLAFKYINDFTKKNIYVRGLSLEERAEKSHNAITKIIERFLKNKNFFVKSSFTSYIYLEVKHEIYPQRKIDMIIDFVDFSTMKEFEENDIFLC